jgi:hypothetical protein
MTMLRMKLAVRGLLHVCLLVALLPIVACSGSPTEVKTFTFTIDNQTDRPLQAFMHTSGISQTFTQVGTPVVPGIRLRISSLTVGPTYTFRVAPVGSSADDFVHEFVATSTGGDLTWIFN